MYWWKRFLGCVAGCKSTAGGETSTPERTPDVICGPMTSLKTFAKDGVDKKVTKIATKTPVCREDTVVILEWSFGDGYVVRGPAKI